MLDRKGILVGIMFLFSLIPSSAPGQDTGPAVSSETGIPAQVSSEETAETTATLKVENSVVQIFATIRPPDFTQPWTKQPAGEVTGTGFVIEGKRILTNAHVVLYSNQLQIQGNQSSDQIPAEVEFIAPGIDLAVLKLEDDSFFESHPPLPRTSDLPAVRDSVLVYGYPIGGNNLSITKGIVSRIDFTPYNYAISGLRVQIDAALNPGNSGGPALVGDKVVGVAFSMLANSQSIGYIIPCEEVDLFLADIADGHYDGKNMILDELQTLENPALRDFLKLDRSTEGLVVHAPFDADPSYPLRQWDVISKIEDTPIDNQGNILLGDNMKIGFPYLVQKLAKNGTIGLAVVRNGRQISVRLPVMHRRPRLVPYLLGTYPSYFILGPIVFSTASEDLVGAIMNSRRSTANALSLSSSPLVTRRNDLPAFEGEELVIVPSPLFAHPVSRGYGHPTMNVVKSINGVKIRSLRHLVEVVRDSSEEFLTIEFSGFITESLVFHRKELIDATEEILNDSGIRSQGSPALMAVWENREEAPDSK